MALIRGVCVFRILGAAVAATFMVACTGVRSVPDDGLAGQGHAAGATSPHRDRAWSAAVDTLLITPPGGDAWQPFLLPGKRFAPFELVRDNGGPALAVRAEQSVSILRRRFDRGLPRVGGLSFSWKVDALPVDARLGEAGKDDAPVRVLLAFDGDRSQWAGRNQRLSEMSRLLTGEELPYATLMYVWANHDAPETIIANPRTDRIRKLVVDSGPAHVGQWRDHERDVRADFIRAFGEPPGPLLSVAVMTDTDNTASRLKVWYGPMRLVDLSVAPQVD
jgi:hypothetical protein